MAGFRDTPRRSDCEPRERKYSGGTDGKARFLPSGCFGPEAPDIPVPLKGMRAVPACDTGLAFQVAQTRTSRGKPPVMGLQELLSLHKEGFVRLDQPILVSFRVTQGRERVKIYSESKEIRQFSLMLTIPCKLGLDVGSTLDMELFLANGQPPLNVVGKVRKVKQSSGQDVVRFALEVEFEQMGKEAERKMAAFIHDAKSHDRRPMHS